MKTVQIRYIIVFLILWVIGTACVPNPKSDKSGVFDPQVCQEKLESLMKRHHIPGLSIAIIRNQQLVWSHSIGVQDIRTDKRVNDSTMFDAASMSKPLTAFVAMILAERGLLNIDSPLSEYCLYPKLDGDQRYKSITARMVMTHTTGLPNWGDRLIHEPGTQFGYSGEGFVYLGKAIEKITGKPLDQIIDEEVFNPCQMKNSSFVWESYYQDNLVSGHDSDGSVIPKKKITIPHGAGTLHTNAEEYAKFIQAIMTNVLLNTESYQEIFSRSVVADNWDADEKIPDIYWGLGWGIQPGINEDQYFHMGNNRFWKGYVVFQRSSGDGLVYFGNSETTHEIADDLIKWVFKNPQSGLRLVQN